MGACSASTRIIDRDVADSNKNQEISHEAQAHRILTRLKHKIHYYMRKRN